MRALQLAPDVRWCVERLGAQQKPAHAAEKEVDDKGAPGAAHHAHGCQTQAAKGEPDREQQFDGQRYGLQPGDELRLAQRLAERAEDAEQQGGRQAPAE